MFTEKVIEADSREDALDQMKMTSAERWHFDRKKKMMLKVAKLRQWHEVFVVFPMFLDDGTFIFMQYVQRRFPSAHVKDGGLSFGLLLDKGWESVQYRRCT